MPLRDPKDVEIDGRSLADIVSAHEEWVKSGYRSGQRAILQRADLRQVNLANADLRQADLTNTDLRGADLGRARLNGAALRGASLRNAVLNGADFTHDTDTVRANTPLLGSAVTELEDTDMGGADMTIALLPPDAPVKRHIRDAATAARGAVRIAAAVACLLTLTVAGLLRTRDADLLRDPALPVIALPLTVVYWIAPVVLLLLYGWWHFSYLDRLWRAAGRLPGFLTEGPSLSSHPPLRPFGFWIARQMPLLVEASESRWDQVRGAMTGFLIWWLTPLILLAAWWRYLALHEPIGTFVHVAVTAASLAIAASWRSSALRSFADQDETPRHTRPILAVFIATLAIGGYSYATLEMDIPRDLIRKLDAPFEDFSQPSPLVLANRDLRAASLAYCSLRDIDLSTARLQGATLTVSDLASADLRNADLRHASLFSARLHNASLDGALLQGANLRCASGLTDAQLAGAVTDAATVFPDGSHGPFQAGAEVTVPDALDCANWRPDGTQLPPQMIERLQRLQDGLPEIDLSPIPELEPSPPSAVPDQPEPPRTPEGD